MRKNEISKLSGKIGGSTLTKEARNHSVKHLFDSLKSVNLMVSHLNDLKAKHIEQYIEIQKQSGVSSRTLQNRMTHIRTMLKQLGRHQLATHERLSSKGLGIADACRDGTHQTLAKTAYEAVLRAANDKNEVTGALMVLQRELGLRAREAVQCGASLQSWKQSLERGAPVRVLHGTKGGRLRDSYPNDTAKALEAVKTALIAFTANEGRGVIASVSLEGAARAYGRDCAAAGLKGAHASHCLRYAYAQDRFEHHLRTLGERKEALAATSLELGHGDGRGTYIAQVYLR
jgi:site-specific recombinase XerC